MDATRVKEKPILLDKLWYGIIPLCHLKTRKNSRQRKIGIGINTAIRSERVNVMPIVPTLRNQGKQYLNIGAIILKRYGSAIANGVHSFGLLFAVSVSKNTVENVHVAVKQNFISSNSITSITTVQSKDENIRTVNKSCLLSSVVGGLRVGTKYCALTATGESYEMEAYVHTS